VLTLGLEAGAGGTKRDTHNAVNLIEPGGFPEGESAFFDHPKLASSESGRGRQSKARGRAILSWCASDEFATQFIRHHLDSCNGSPLDSTKMPACKRLRRDDRFILFGSAGSIIETGLLQGWE
jgi:hypothetical protein